MGVGWVDGYGGKGRRGRRWLQIRKFAHKDMGLMVLGSEVREL